MNDENFFRLNETIQQEQAERAAIKDNLKNFQAAIDEREKIFSAELEQRHKQRMAELEAQAEFLKNLIGK